MLEGILPLWKEKGMTSHDCVFRLRKILGMKRIGHTGTLDPDVEGVLPICLGRATKAAEYITDMGKTYEAVVSIGRSTETEDASGATVEQDLAQKCFSDTEIRDVLQSLTGEITQVPPMYSAVKVNGKRLYEYARQGQSVERPFRKVMIREIELLSSGKLFEGTEVDFRIRVDCGKGTYIRTLAVQIGEKLGFPAHMASLVRTASGPFTAKDCLTLAEVEQQRERGILEASLLPVERALSEFPCVNADEAHLQKILNGQVLPAHPLLAEHQRIVFMDSIRAVAVYRRHPEKTGLMKPEKMFGMVEDKR
ncbi:tRNA pseudouridine synthase B [Bhargavaea cecembensis]|uniref:tRNA pseudouridine synthase B n=1 Tax=Bhargavaea cecembensis TaxID=394098 RepID=A0A161SRS6_9BACL|nr:tRNA pseudouridine(55) synthase TruB [Bhargavaea cecembensis]KZE38150.1 tRNA pseudouridine synthase B [Bhargavaea cecembensis]